jgi:hypothetical protein
LFYLSGHLFATQQCANRCFTSSWEVEANK